MTINMEVTRQDKYITSGVQLALPRSGRDAGEGGNHASAYQCSPETAEAENTCRGSNKQTAGERAASVVTEEG